MGRFAVCSGPPERRQNSQTGLPLPDTDSNLNGSTRGWRSSRPMLQATIPILVFVAVACGAFAAGMLLDQRRARARLIRERLAPEQNQPGRETLALLRDEMFSRIPAFDTLLRRSERISRLQVFLDQAGLSIRAGNLLIVCLLVSILMAVIAYILAEPLPSNDTIFLTCVGIVLGAVLPYLYASWRRSRRFQKFETTFPDAIDTLARAVRAGHAF